MRYLRCQCGKSEMFTTDTPRDCQGCDECGTTYAGAPGHHQPRAPHDLKVQYDQNTGAVSHKICEKCYERVKI